MHLIAGPVYTRFVSSHSPTHFCSASLLIEGVSYALFGFSVFVDNTVAFVVIAFTLRVVNGLTGAIYSTASLLIIIKEFPSNTASMIAFSTIFTGLGVLTGPTLGGGLYQMGGFLTPFAVSGGMQLVGGLLFMAVMPVVDKKTEDKGANHWDFLLDFEVVLDGLTVVTVNYFLAFNTTTLEPHLRRFQ